jgi:AcrR family transcriptional regulator
MQRDTMARLTDTLARRAVERSVGDRQAEYALEMQRIVEITFGLIERTGTLDPSLRDILRETGLSTQAFYRYFQSKDELLLLLLDDGRRQLLGYLDHRMAGVAGSEAKIRAWIEGVLAQAGRPRAAARTRPFVTNQSRLAEAFPAEQQASVESLIDQLAAVLAPPGRRIDVRRDAEAIYRLVFATLQNHLMQGSRPNRAETDHVVRFALRGVGLTSGRS